MLGVLCQAYWVNFTLSGLLGVICLVGFDEQSITLQISYVGITISGGKQSGFTGSGWLGWISWIRFAGPGVLGLICFVGLHGLVYLVRFAWWGLLIWNSWVRSILMGQVRQVRFIESVLQGQIYGVIFAWYD